MKRVQRILLYFLFLSVVFGCKKTEPKTPAQIYTISGTLKESCGGFSVSNGYLELIQSSGIGTPAGQTLYTYTDSAGRFSFSYKNKNGEGLLLDYGVPGAFANQRLLVGIPASENIDIGNVYLQNKNHIYLKINHYSAHSVNDNLYYAVRYNGPIKTLIGPFPTISVDSILVEKGSFIGGDASYNVPIEDGILLWGLNYNDFLMASASLAPETPDYHIEHFNFRGCGYNDTALINVP